MDQVRDELLYSNIKGKNPFKDIRVREAFYKAIDVELIKTRVMRGLSTPSALMIAPQLFPLFQGLHAAEVRSRRRQEAAGRSRLSRRLRSHHGLPERSLRQRRRDLPGRGRHAGPHRRQGEPAGAAQGAVFRQGAEARRLPDLVLPARLDARHASIPTTCCTTSWAAATIRRTRPAAKPISAATATRKWTRSPTRCWSKTDTAKRDQLIKQAYEIAIKDYGLYPAAPAGAGVGRFEKSETDPARRQPGPALLGDQTGMRRFRSHRVPAASRFRDLSFPVAQRGVAAVRSEVKG